MIRRPPRSTRTDTLCPYTTLFRSRGRDFRLRCLLPGQLAEPPAVELDDELHQPRRTRLAGLAAAPDAGGHHAGAFRRIGLVGLPVQAVAQAVALAGLGGIARYPEGDDVVVDLVVGGDLHQLHGAGAPGLQRLDPEARAALVMHAIEIVLERAVALQQAEAARPVVDEGGGGHVLGIVEWPPEPLAGAGPEREPVGIRSEEHTSGLQPL